MSAIELADLTKVYATGVTAVDRLTLDVADGEFVVLVGPVRLRQDHRAAHGRGA